MSSPDTPVPSEVLAEWLGLPELVMKEDIGRFTQVPSDHHRAILDMTVEEREITFDLSTFFEGMPDDTDWEA